MIIKLRQTYSAIMRAHPLLIPVALLLVCYVTNVVFFWRNGLDIIDSDASSEMVLSALLNREGGIMSRNWFYSTELRVLNDQIVYRLFLLLFPGNWHLARTLSAAVLVLLLVLCICDLCAVAGRLSTGLYISAAVISPISPLYGSHIIYKCYYIPHIAISVLTLSLLLRVFRYQDAPRERRICTILVLLLAFVACLGGVRQLMVLYGPLWCGICGLYILRRKDRAVLRKLLLLSSWLVISGICGYFVNMKLFSRIFTFVDFSGMTLTGFQLEELLRTLEKLITLYGGWVSAEEVPFFSFAGAEYFLGLGLFALVMLSVVFLLRRVKTLPLADAVFTAFITALLVITLLILSQMGSSGSAGYWIPVMPFTFFLPFMLCEQISRERWQLPVVVLFFVCACATMRTPQVTMFPSSETMRDTAEWLVENGHTKGVASFWYSNIMTELSNGEIEMWTVYDVTMPRLVVYEWLQETSHRQLPEGEFFLLVSKTSEPENGIFENEAFWPYLVYGDEYFTVYLFESTDTYQALYY